jgi:hypothetical protein
MTNSV